jgi:tetratricopeptide (TPR) repeat protein
MKRALTTSLAALTLVSMTYGCGSLQNLSLHRGGNPYEGRIFYTKYLNPQGSALDARIQHDLDQLRTNPDLASVHNDLGQALLEKGFPKDAEVEFERSVDADRRFYPGWYNLGLVRESRGNFTGARFAFRRAVAYKPGHAPALFQLGLMSEKCGDNSEAIEYLSKAFLINRQLLDVRVNPRILDSHLIDLALVKAYPDHHARASMQFQGAPVGYIDATEPALSPQPTAAQIVTPAAPVTDPGKQKVPPNPKP